MFDRIRTIITEDVQVLCPRHQFFIETRGCNHLLIPIICTVNESVCCTRQGRVLPHNSAYNTGIKRNQFKGLHLQMTFWMGLTMLTSTFSFTSDVTNKIIGKKIISNLFHTNGFCLVLSTLQS